MKLFESKSVGITAAPLIAIAVLCFGTVARAADGDVSVSGGAISMDGGVGTHALVNAQAGVRFGQYVHVFGEFGWSQLATDSQQSSSGGVTINANGSADLANFGGGMELGLGSNRRIVPYFVTAGGLGHFYAKGSGSSSTGATASVTIPIANSPYFATGGGLRFFIGKHWGFKPEVRFQRYVGSLQSNSLTYTGGLFWQFGE